VADRVQLQQVILNLVMNAFESMSVIDDLPRLLDVGAEIYGADTVKVFVRDSGPGIGTGDRNRIFSAFYTTKVGGMGMGLAICRTIVESHGGQLWATPNEGPGETFQFTVPIAAPEPQPEPHTKV
jgi:signal transduction histidine kinase